MWESLEIEFAMPAFSPVALNSGTVWVWEEELLSRALPTFQKEAIPRIEPHLPKERRGAVLLVITDSDAALYKRQFLLTRNRLVRGSSVTRK